MIAVVADFYQHSERITYELLRRDRDGDAPEWGLRSCGALTNTLWCASEGEARRHFNNLKLQATTE